MCVSFGSDPTCKTYRFKFLFVLRQVKVPNSSCIFKTHWGVSMLLEIVHIRVSVTFLVEQANLLWASALSYSKLD